MHRLTSLHTVFCSGEALTPALVERFNRVFGAIGGAAASESLRANRGDGGRELL